MNKKIIPLSFLLLLVSCNGISLKDLDLEPTGTNTITGCTSCRIFISTLDSTGDFGGASAADQICNSDVAKPTTSQYKALIFDNTRNATLNCVLKPSTNYYRSNGTTLIGTTNAQALLPVFSPSSLVNSITSSSSKEVWTGADLTSPPFWNTSTDNCDNWTNLSSGAAVGLPNQTDTQILDSFGDSCNTNYWFICVEQ